MKNIQEMTVEELKALAYDQAVLLQQAQNNLQILTKEIESRQKPIEDTEKKK